MTEPTKEKKYFGPVDFINNTSKWGKVFIAALLLLVLSLTASRVYDTYQKQNCGAEGCATTEAEEVQLIQKRTDLEVVPTGEKVVLKNLTYKLYQVENTQFYALIGWEDLKEKGWAIRDTIAGVEEKELLTIDEHNGMFVWGMTGTTLKVSENNKVIGEYQKEMTDIKLIQIKMEKSEDVFFE